MSPGVDVETDASGGTAHRKSTRRGNAATLSKRRGIWKAIAVRGETTTQDGNRLLTRVCRHCLNHVVAGMAYPLTATLARRGRRRKPHLWGQRRGTPHAR